MKKNLKKLSAMIVLMFISIIILNAKCYATEVTVETLKAEYPSYSVWNDNYYGSTECAGFAFLMYDKYYGVNPLYVERTHDLSTLKAGDILRYSGHSVWVTDINGDTITIGECNIRILPKYDYANMVLWGRQISKSGIPGLEYIIPAPYAIDEKTTVISVENITLSKTSATLEIGETLELTATISPNNATQKTITWTSSNPNIATVSNGKITAISAGTVNITATAGDKTATCVLEVKEAEENTITIAIKSKKFKLENNMILGIEAETTLADFLNNFEINNDYEIGIENSKEIIETGNIFIIKKKDNPSISKKLECVVIGDLNSDGKISIRDARLVAQYVASMGTTGLTAAQIKAGDIHNSGDGLTIRDARQIAITVATKQ